jgi:sialate O-acetylesterase
MARRLLAWASALLAVGAASAAAADEPRFAGIFSDHAVLQRDVPINLWGQADPGARLTVQVAEQSLVVRADDAGHWRVRATPLQAGGPYKLKVSDDAGHGATLSDILVGDVWLCGGQSNMELKTGSATNAWNETHASANPNLRFVNIERDAEPLKQDSLKKPVQWKVAATETTGDSSAVCYYMAKALQAAEKVPIGFINSSWGGTPVEAWMTEPTLRKTKAYEAGLDLLAQHAKAPAGDPTPAPSGAPWEAGSGLSILYNGMIAPLAPYRIKGAAWYQGESNWKNAARYQQLLTAMIGDWRETFADPDLPFLIVQLPSYGAPAAKPTDTPWATLREAERRTAVSTPDAGLAVALDVGDRYDLHPSQKAVVGKRLAVAARRVAYGETIAVSPAPLRIERRGRDLVVTFSDAADGLTTYSSGEAIGFETCDAAKSCRFVEAAPSKNTVVLKGANDPSVRYVRYAWGDAPFVNLFNSDDLPATPFEMAVP